MKGGRPQFSGGYSTPRGGGGGGGGGRFSRSAGHASHNTIGAADGTFSDSSINNISRSGISHGRSRKKNTPPYSPSGFPGYVNHASKPVVVEYRVKKPAGDASCLTEKHHQDQTPANAVTTNAPNQPEIFVASNSTPDHDSALLPACSSSQGTSLDLIEGGALHLVPSHEESTTLFQNVCKMSLQSSAKDQRSQEHLTKSSMIPTRDSGNSENSAALERFDICMPMTGTHVKLKPSLLAQNKEKRNETKRALEGQRKILQPGMILLKGYLSMDDQVKIVNKCRNLGLGSGGFYQPGYRDDAKLHLKMMCLGKNWDPSTSKYGELRPIDGSKPPAIPPEFHNVVEKAMKDSTALMLARIEEDIPQISPDICIVNFYSASGRLGLHQDKDESEGSLRKGLPVVSFSIGDTGEFQYADNRDEKDPKKVLLESGDVLIFGGKSRHIFHGVCSIHANTAPKSLLDKTNLRAGRLNLTFRQY